MENYFYYLIQEFEYMNSFELDPANYLYTPVCGCNKKVYVLSQILKSINSLQAS